MGTRCYPAINLKSFVLKIWYKQTLERMQLIIAVIVLFLMFQFFYNTFIDSKVISPEDSSIPKNVIHLASPKKLHGH